MNILITAAVVVACLVVGYGLYAFVLKLIWPMPAPHDEEHCVTTEDGWTITLFRHRAAKEGGEPVLLCHGAFANRFNLVMPVSRGIAASLTEAGYDCWAIEYRGSESGQPPAGVAKESGSLDDYLLYDLPAAVDYIREHTGHPKIHWVGHSMGGMLFYAFDQVFGGEALASATTLGAPIGFKGTKVRPEPFLLALHKRMPWLFLDLVRATIPIIRPLKLRLPFLPVNPWNIDPALPTRHLYRMIGYMNNRVINDLHDIAVSQDWRMDGGSLDVVAGLPHLETPLFVVLGVQDPFVPVAEGEGFYHSIFNPDKRLLVLSKEHGHSADYNHVDLSMAPSGRYEVSGAIVEWLQAHPVSAVGKSASTTAPKVPPGPKDPPAPPPSGEEPSIMVTPGGRTRSTALRGKSAAKAKPKAAASKKKAAAKKKSTAKAKSNSKPTAKPKSKPKAKAKPKATAKAKPKATAKKKPAAKKKAATARKSKEN